MRLSRSFHAKLARVAASLATGDESAAHAFFAIFWRDTRVTWRGIALQLFARWTPPTGASTDDVEQELSMACWNLLRDRTYDPDKGRTLADYLVFNACNKAKYWLHKQRGASLHGNRDKHPTRAPRSFDHQALQVDDETQTRFSIAVMRQMRQPATQEIEVDRRTALLALLDECGNTRERFALVALHHHGGNEASAIRAIYNDPVIRQLCRFGSVRQAKTAVRRTINIYGQLAE